MMPNIGPYRLGGPMDLEKQKYFEWVK